MSAFVVRSINCTVIEFENMTYNFGKADEGEKIFYTFKFINSGRTPLIISSAKASCGCTVADFTHEPVKPGDKGMIHVEFDSRGLVGVQNKIITVIANTTPAVTELFLTGFVNPITVK